MFAQTALSSQILHSVSLVSASSSSLQSTSSSHQLPGVLVQNYTLWREEAGSVEEALFSLTTALEDFRGHYHELEVLEDAVSSLDAFIRVCTLFLHLSL